MKTMTEQPAPVRRWDFDRVFRLMLLGGGVLGLLWLLRFLADVLVPFAVALLLSYLLQPIVKTLESRLRGRRMPAVFLTVGGVLAVCVAAVLILVPLTWREFAAFGAQIRQLGQAQEVEPAAPAGDHGGETGESLAQAYRRFRDRQPVWLQDALDRGVAGLSDGLSTEHVSALVTDLARRIAPGLLGLVSGFISFLVGLSGIIVILLYLVFILLDYERVAGRWSEFLPPAYRGMTLQFVDEFALTMKRYFRGQFLVSAAMGVLFAVGFKLIGLRLGVLLGLCVGLLSMIPYLQVVGLVPALLLVVLRALEHGSGVIRSLCLVLLVFAVVQAVQEVLLIPRIIGRTTGLRPVAIMLGVFIWGKLLGFLGLVLAIPLTCLALAYYSRFVLGQHDTPVPKAE